MTRLPRAICPVCGRGVALRRGGQLREHPAVQGARGLCPGSGKTQESLLPRERFLGPGPLDSGEER